MDVADPWWAANIRPRNDALLPLASMTVMVELASLNSFLNLGHELIKLSRQRPANFHSWAESGHCIPIAACRKGTKVRSFADQRRITDFDPKRKFGLPLLCARSGH